MARGRASRWLAPLAIVAVGGAAYGILKSGTGNSGSTPAAKRQPAKKTATDGDSGTTPTTTTVVTTKRTYIVRSGDTLSSISLETGVSVDTLQNLNPDVDVQALQPGERLKLRS